MLTGGRNVYDSALTVSTPKGNPPTRTWPRPIPRSPLDSPAGLQPTTLGCTANPPNAKISMAAFNLADGPAYILLATTTSIIWTIKVLLIRLWMRLKINGPFSKDDWMCVVSTLFGICYASIVMLEVAQGLGDTRTAPKINTIDILSWTNQYFLTLSVCFSKLSACFLIARITKTREHIAVAHALVAAVAIWALQSMLFNTFQCPYPHPWKSMTRNGCSNLWGHSLGNALASYILELALLAAATHLVCSTQMSYLTKSRVITAFALRLLLIPASIIRLHYLHGMLHSAHPETFTVRCAIMNLVTCQISVLSATFPCAKPFFTAFTKGIWSRGQKGHRASILPTQYPKARMPCAAGSATTSASATHHSTHHHSLHDRRFSLTQLHLGPIRGISTTTVTHVPDEVLAKVHRPSLVNSKHSNSSILYTRTYDVSFQDVGGLVEQDRPGGSCGGQRSPGGSCSSQGQGERGRGSSAGFSWNGSAAAGRRKSSARSRGLGGSGEFEKVEE